MKIKNSNNGTVSTANAKNKDVLIAKLKAKKEKLIEETKKYDDRVFLPRTLLFSTLKNQTKNYRKVYAIDLALSLISGKHIRDVDCYQLVVMTMPATNELYDNLLKKADSIYLNERKEVIRAVIEHALPICKKQVMEGI